MACGLVAAHSQGYPSCNANSLRCRRQLTDTLARLLGNRMASLGADLVENVASGSGTIAAMNVVRSAPDGYTVFITSNTTHASNQTC
jgi:tripartite-type tricarboxylate transporter receptor subunit TctC